MVALFLTKIFFLLTYTMCLTKYRAFEYSFDGFAEMRSLKNVL